MTYTANRMTAADVLAAADAVLSGPRARLEAIERAAADERLPGPTAAVRRLQAAVEQINARGGRGEDYLGDGEHDPTPEPIRPPYSGLELLAVQIVAADASRAGLAGRGGGR